MSARSYALAALTFVFVTAEMFPIGALPQMSAGLRIPEARTGLLLTGYAVVAGVAAMPVVSWTRHLERRALVTGSALLLAGSQLGMALSPGFWEVFAFRVVGALGHGLIWSAGPVIAARLAPPERSGRAASIVFVGGSGGLVLGSPLCAVLSQSLGWRWAAVVIAAVALVAAAALRLALPVLPGGTPASMAHGAAKTGTVWAPVAIICFVTAALFTAHYLSYTYLAVLMDVRGVSGRTYAVMLVLYGGAGLLVVRPVGIAMDLRPRLTSLALIAALVVGVSGYALARGVPWVIPGLLVWAGAFSAVPVLLKARVLRVAPDDADRSSAAYVAATQVGISGGSALGAVLMAAAGSGWLPWLTALMAAPMLVIVLRARRAFG